MHTFSTRWIVYATSPPSATSRYGAVPFWKIGSETSAWSSSNAESTAPHARVPVASGQGDAAAPPQRTQFVAAGAAAADTAAESFEAGSRGGPTVKTATSKIDV